MAQLDTEWMKFMSRISRQQNCDDADDDIISSGDESSLITQQSSVVTTTAVKQQPGHPNSASASAAVKKSCISKKAQRRTYSFLDASTADVAGVALVTPSEHTAAAAPEREFHSKISPIYISTKTKIAYLNKPVSIYDAFWNVPVQHYYERKEGVIKKQIDRKSVV